jgi:hypothetical protein
VSSLRLYQTCPRKFSYRYYYGIEGRREPSDKIKFGTAFAKTVELNAGKPAANYWSVAESARGLDADLGAQLAGTAAAYSVYWSGSLAYRATELRLETELRNPRLRLVSVLDGLVETPAGELAVVDQKTTESDIRPGSWFFEKLSLDLQASTYIYAARANGFPVAKAIWDAVKRPTTRRRTEAVAPEYYSRSGKWGSAGDLKPGTGIPAETLPEFAKRIRDNALAEPQAYFQRADVVRLDDELEQALADVHQVGAQVLASWDSNEFPRSTGSCFQYGERCEFFEVCTGAASPHDEQLYQIRSKRA